MRYFIFSICVLLLAGCKKEADEVPSEELKSMDMAVAQVAAATYDSAGYDDDGKSKDAESFNFEAKIIKSADLAFETQDLEATYQKVRAAVKKHQALIQNDAEGKDEVTLNRSLVVRVPNKSFDAFIAEISDGVSYFDRKQINSEDVTEEYVDVSSRIKTKKALEDRYLELLKKANKVSEMLEVERQLSQIREEIESKEARLKYLQTSVAMSTVNIEFYKPLSRNGAARVSFGSKIGNAITTGFNGIADFFIGLIEVWPIIVILVALIFVFRKRFRRRKTA